MPRSWPRKWREDRNSSSICTMVSLISAASLRRFHSRMRPSKKMQSLSADFASSRCRPASWYTGPSCASGFGAWKILQILFGETMEEPLDFPGEQNQRIPGAIHGKIIAARIKDGHLPPELRHGAQDLELTGEKLFVKHRDLDVFHAGVLAEGDHPLFWRR